MRIDSVAPNIREIIPKDNMIVSSSFPKIRFKTSTNSQGFAIPSSSRSMIAVYPEYDPESGTVTAIPHFKLSNGKHELQIRVTDRVGNSRRISTEFSVGGKKSKQR